MFPSPSDGPPWLSESASPAFAPWGMPLLEPEDWLVELEPEDWVEVAAGVELDVELDEPPEPDPHAAAASAASTSRTAPQ
jgi:hypothetical protein